MTRLQRDYPCACWLSTLAVVTPRRTTEQQKNLGLSVHLLRLVQLTYRLPGSGHDGGQLVRDYQHPRASRSHAPEAGEASLETDPRGTVRGRGTTFRTVSPVLLLFLFSLRLVCTPFYLFSSSSLCNEVTASTYMFPTWNIERRSFFPICVLARSPICRAHRAPLIKIVYIFFLLVFLSLFAYLF